MYNVLHNTKELWIFSFSQIDLAYYFCFIVIHIIIVIFSELVNFKYAVASLIAGTIG